MVNWCGHREGFIPWPESDGWVRLVSIVGEAA
jgi:hypothetical protein